MDEKRGIHGENRGGSVFGLACNEPQGDTYDPCQINMLVCLSAQITVEVIFGDVLTWTTRKLEVIFGNIWKLGEY